MSQPDPVVADLRAELSRGRLKPVEEYVGKHLAECSASGPLELELRLLRAMAWRRMGRRRETAAELELLKEACAANGEKRIGLLVQLEDAKLIYAGGDLPAAIECASQVFAGAVAGGFSLVQAETQHLLGLVNSSAGHGDAAQACLAEALRGFEALGETDRAADSRSMLGMTYVAQGRNLEGINLWRQSMLHHENEGNIAELAHDLTRLGFATWCEGDMDQTRATLLRVLQIDSANPGVVSAQVTLMARTNLAGVELLERRLDAVQEHLAVAEHIALLLGDGMILVSLHLYRAKLAALRGLFSEALACASAAESCAAEINYQLPLYSQMGLAVLYAIADSHAAGQARWPEGAVLAPVAENAAFFRSILQLLEVLDDRAADAPGSERAVYAAWRAQVSELTAARSA